MVRILIAIGEFIMKTISFFCKESITILFLVFFYVSPTYGEYKMDLEKLIQTALDHEELVSYYHASEHPERIPLKLLCFNTDCRSFNLNKFDQPIEILDRLPSNDNVIIINSVVIKKEIVSFNLTYPIEGVRAEFSFKVNNSTSVCKPIVTVFEE